MFLFNIPLTIIYVKAVISNTTSINRSTMKIYAIIYITRSLKKMTRHI